jgi:hypothetical protein
MLYFLFESTARKESMKTIFHLLLSLCTISFFAHQSNAQHQISFQPAAFNYFFDNSPMKSSQIPGFRNYNYGVQYQYQKPNNKLISAQFNLIRESNRWDIADLNLMCGNFRRIKEVNVTFSRQKQLLNKVNWTYGAGPTLRNVYYVTDTIDAAFPVEFNLYQSHHLQLGLKGQTSLSYTPFKWLTLYSQLNFSGYLLSRKIYINSNNDFIQDFGPKQRFNFPSRIHSSLTFGVGINF